MRNRKNEAKLIIPLYLVYASTVFGEGLNCMIINVLDPVYSLMEDIFNNHYQYIVLKS